MDLFTADSYRRRFLLIGFLLCLTLISGGCKRRRRAQANAESNSPAVVGLVPAHVETRDPAVAGQLLKGFYKVEDSWRWTAAQFSVLLGIPKDAVGAGAVLRLHFVIPDVVLSKLHAQTISASIDGKPLGPETYRMPGAQTYTRPVAADLLRGQGISVDFTADPVLPPSSADMRELGVIVYAITLDSK